MNLCLNRMLSVLNPTVNKLSRKGKKCLLLMGVVSLFWLSRGHQTPALVWVINVLIAADLSTLFRVNLCEK